MAGWFDRIFGRRSRALSLARSAELRGDLVRAAELFARAGRPDEANRVRKTQALSILATAGDVPATPIGRLQLAQAGSDLESLGEFARAAEAYGRAEDVEAQGRALARAGDIDSLDALLDADEARAREARQRLEGHELFDMAVASGQRRDAAKLARASVDRALRARGRDLEARRLAKNIVRVTMGGRRTILILGNQVVLGRASEDAEAPFGTEGEPGQIVVRSAAVSRRHLMFGRRADRIVLRDLGSHNGTMHGGERIAGEMNLDDGLDLRLGGEVTLVARPADDLPGAVAIEITGVRYVAPLGPARLGIGRWRLECAAVSGLGRWVELVTDDEPPAFAAGLRLAGRVTLLSGDVISTDRDGDGAIVFED